MHSQKGFFCRMDSSIVYISFCLLYRVIYLNNMVNIYTGIVLLAVLQYAYMLLYLKCFTYYFHTVFYFKK